LILLMRICTIMMMKTKGQRRRRKMRREMRREMNTKPSLRRFVLPS